MERPDTALQVVDMLFCPTMSPAGVAHSRCITAVVSQLVSQSPRRLKTLALTRFTRLSAGVMGHGAAGDDGCYVAAFCRPQVFDAWRPAMLNAWRSSLHA
jgi:hypothetical protein